MYNDFISGTCIWKVVHNTVVISVRPRYDVWSDIHSVNTYTSMRFKLKTFPSTDKTAALHISSRSFLKSVSVNVEKPIWSWWRQMETFFLLLALCEGNPPFTGGFPSQRPVTPNFDIFCDLGLNKRLRKQSRSRWFDTLSCSLWRHRDVEWTFVSRVALVKYETVLYIYTIIRACKIYNSYSMRS